MAIHPLGADLFTRYHTNSQARKQRSLRHQSWDHKERQSAFVSTRPRRLEEALNNVSKVVAHTLRMSPLTPASNCQAQ
jgi:hypothetical protein